MLVLALMLMSALMIGGTSADKITFSVWTYSTNPPYVCNNPSGPIFTTSAVSPECMGYTNYYPLNKSLSKVKVLECIAGKLISYTCPYTVVYQADGYCNASGIDLKTQCTASIANPYLCETLQTGLMSPTSTNLKVISCDNTLAPGSSSDTASISPARVFFLILCSVVALLL